MTQQCLICKSEVPSYSWNHPEPGARIKCELCGEYRMSERLARDIFSCPLHDSHIFSGAIREHYEQGIVLWVEDLNELRYSVVIPKNPLQSIDRILLHVLRKIKSADDGVEFKQTDRSIAYARNASEFEYLLWQARELGYLEKHPQGQSRDRLTLTGWKYLANLPHQEIKPSQAFVAMWFHENLEDAWENGLKPALKQTGYDPIRLDRTEYNEKVDDRIVAEIRKSGLLIADFTGHRGNVYFEAGFSMGLGIPIIWTCRATDINDLHFDTRQYNYIVWNDIAELKERLINRIEATLPNRPKPKLEGLR